MDDGVSPDTCDLPQSLGGISPSLVGGAILSPARGCGETVVLGVVCLDLESSRINHLEAPGKRNHLSVSCCSSIRAPTVEGLRALRITNGRGL